MNTRNSANYREGRHTYRGIRRGHVIDIRPGRVMNPRVQAITGEIRTRRDTSRVAARLVRKEKA
ncbi:MAG: hypothetical protein ACTHLW_21160 [Verrucomicrobiota bacterium]